MPGAADPDDPADDPSSGEPSPADAPSEGTAPGGTALGGPTPGARPTFGAPPTFGARPSSAPPTVEAPASPTSGGPASSPPAAAAPPTAPSPPAPSPPGPSAGTAPPPPPPASVPAPGAAPPPTPPPPPTAEPIAANPFSGGPTPGTAPAPATAPPPAPGDRSASPFDASPTPGAPPPTHPTGARPETTPTPDTAPPTDAPAARTDPATAGAPTTPPPPPASSPAASPAPASPAPAAPAAARPTDPADVDPSSGDDLDQSLDVADDATVDVAAAAAGVSGDVHAASPLSAERDDDLDDLLARLHEDMDLEASPTPTGDTLTDPREFERSQMPDRDEVVIESTGGLDFRPDHASLSRRLVGFLVDQLAVLLAVAPGVAIAVSGSGALLVVVGVVVSIVGFAAAATWYSRAIPARGRWIGNRITGTRVVDIRNGSPVASGHALTRFLIRHLGAIFVVPWAMALRDTQRQAFHDRLVGSVVVGRARQAWSVDDDPDPSTASG